MFYSRLFFLILLFSPISLFAETILFNDGTKLQGKIITQNKNTVTLQIAEGQNTTIDKEDILKIIYKDRISEEEEARIREKEKQVAINKQAEVDEIERIKKEKLPLESSEKKEIAFVPKSDIKNANSDTSPMGAFWRSLLIPGWGQFYEGRKIAGVLYPSLIFVGVGALYQKDRIYRNSLKDYNDYQNPYSDTYLTAAALGLPTPFNNSSLVVNFSGSSNDIFLNYYNSTESPIAKQKKTVEQHYNEMRTISYIVAALWIWNAVDAYLFHPSRSRLSQGNDLNIPEKGDIRIKMDSFNSRTSYTSSATEHRVYLETYF
jgi:hypothetical protein